MKPEPRQQVRAEQSRLLLAEIEAMFCDTVAGANAGANLYSIAETCKANGVDVYQYLVALFKALPRAQAVDDYEALLAWAVAASSKNGYSEPDSQPDASNSAARPQTDEKIR